jgi:hypothetical protein
MEEEGTGQGGNVGSWKLESPDELQEDLIMNGGKGNSFWWSCREI